MFAAVVTYPIDPVPYPQEDIDTGVFEASRVVFFPPSVEDGLGNERKF